MPFPPVEILAAETNTSILSSHGETRVYPEIQTLDAAFVAVQRDDHSLIANLYHARAVLAAASQTKPT
jgi:hypothetical protein